MAEAPVLAAWYEEHIDDNVMVIDLVGEGNGVGAPDQAGLEWWAMQAGATFPVLADDGWAVTSRYHGASLGLPSFVEVAPGMEIFSIPSWWSPDEVLGLANN